MMQVLDRVVPSGNLATLALLIAVAVMVFAVQGAVETCRDVTLQRASHWIEKTGTTHALVLPPDNRQSILDDTVTLRDACAGPAAIAGLNLPWLPLFAITLLLVHPYFLALVVVIVATLMLIKSIVQFLTSSALNTGLELGRQERQILSNSTNPTVIAGMQAASTNLANRFASVQDQKLSYMDLIAPKTALKASMTNGLRMFGQIAALSVGAILVINGNLSAGAMIGASIIVSKTIATVETVTNSWTDITNAKKAYTRLLESSQNLTKTTEHLDLTGKLTAQDLIHPRGGGAPPRLDRISLSLETGECLAIVGDSGSGKTTLLNALSGVSPCPIGSVRFDETDVRTLGPETSQKSIGYLPQQAQLLSGTIAENICCFDPNPNDKRIIAAARTAGVHGLISSLPEGYATDFGANGHLLSAGQKQRVALARAIFERPKYLFLDEPNALLDAAGERQLCDTLALLKKQGTTIVMVLHRSGIMGLADKVLVLDHGRMTDFGARAEVLGRMNDGKQRLQLPLNPASVQDLNDWVVAQFLRHSDTDFRQKSVIVATEMFNAACQNGAQDMRRTCTIIFRFVDENHCELMLTEDAKTEAADKMTKIRSLVQHPEVDMVDLEPDEIALAVVSQMTDTLEVKNTDEASLFAARLSADKLRQKPRIAH